MRELLLFLLDAAKHVIWFSLFLFLGCTFAGILYAGDIIGGMAISIWGFAFGWPALVMGSLYTEFVRRKCYDDD